MLVALASDRQPYDRDSTGKIMLKPRWSSQSGGEAGSDTTRFGEEKVGRKRTVPPAG